MGQGGYDISVATSESATTASSAGSGAFKVGGDKTSKWVLPVMAFMALGMVWLFVKRE
jgi:hypothetical protein